MKDNKAYEVVQMEEVSMVKFNAPERPVEVEATQTRPPVNTEKPIRLFISKKEVGYVGRLSNGKILIEWSDGGVSICSEMDIENIPESLVAYIAVDQWIDGSCGLKQLTKENAERVPHVIVEYRRGERNPWTMRVGK